MRLQLDGILPPITTPFDDRGELDLAALECNLGLYDRTGLAGYVAFGSNGEAVHLEPDERQRVLATVRAAAGGRTVVAGVNELSTRAAVRAVHEAADAGADAALVITPYFYKKAMTGDALRGFFLAVAEASPLPVLAYNVPQNTGVTIAPATLAELAGHDRIVGVKDSAGDLGALSDTLRRTPADFRVMVGNASILYPALLMGAAGAILAVACVAPEAAVELYEAARAGDHERAHDLQNRLAPLAHLVTAGYGVAGLKVALDLAGLAGGPPRGPLEPLGKGERAHLADVMRESGLFARVPA